MLLLLSVRQTERPAMAESVSLSSPPSSDPAAFPLLKLRDRPTPSTSYADRLTEKA